MAARVSPRVELVSASTPSLLLQVIPAIVVQNAAMSPCRRPSGEQVLHAPSKLFHGGFDIERLESHCVFRLIIAVIEATNVFDSLETGPTDDELNFPSALCASQVVCSVEVSRDV